MNIPEAQNKQQTDYSFSMNKANIFSILFLLVCALCLCLPFIVFWGKDKLIFGLKSFVFDLEITFPVLILGTILHELLHGIGFWFFGRKKMHDVEFGFNTNTFTPYTYCKIPVTAKVYKIGLMLPCVILGVIPAFFGLFWGHASFLIFGILFISTAGADILTFWKIKNVGNAALIQDHPDKAGCFVISPE